MLPVAVTIYFIDFLVFRIVLDIVTPSKSADAGYEIYVPGENFFIVDATLIIKSKLKERFLYYLSHGKEEIWDSKFCLVQVVLPCQLCLTCKGDSKYFRRSTRKFWLFGQEVIFRTTQNTVHVLGRIYKYKSNISHIEPDCIQDQCSEFDSRAGSFPLPNKHKFLPTFITYWNFITVVNDINNTMK